VNHGLSRLSPCLLNFIGQFQGRPFEDEPVFQQVPQAEEFGHFVRTGGTGGGDPEIHFQGILKQVQVADIGAKIDSARLWMGALDPAVR
jgi:hypothetical protein